MTDVEFGLTTGAVVALVVVVAFAGFAMLTDPVPSAAHQAVASTEETP